MKTGLSALIHPLSMNDFLKQYSADSAFMVRPDPSDLKPILELNFLNSLEALLNSWPHVIQAHLPDFRDEISSIDTNARDAGKLFASGMGLLFNEAQTISPVLESWLQEVRSDLGISALTMGRCLIYATPDGQGTAPHFDQNINFVLQLHGTKKWKVAKEPSVINPLSRHTMGGPMDPELASYAEELKMPEATEFNLTPGSLLFVPRGCWHSTEAEGDALALNFTFSAPSWLDLFLAALRGRLALSPEWRETADGVCSPERRQLAEQRFNQLLGHLVEDLPHWRAEDILSATEPE